MSTTVGVDGQAFPTPSERADEKISPSYFHHFLPFAPPVPADQLSAVRCLQQALYKTKSGHEISVSLMGRPHTIDAIAVTIPATVPEANRSDWIKKIGNGLLSVIRLTHDAQKDVIRNGDGFINICMETDDPIPRYEIAISDVVNQDHVVDVQNIASVFSAVHHPEREPIIALLAESQFPPLPTHYKILSLVRAIELLLPTKNERYDWLDRYQTEFAALHISAQQFRNALPELRTRCAHGESRGGAKPFVEPAYNDLSALAGLLRRVVIERIGNAYGVHFTLPDERQ